MSTPFISDDPLYRLLREGNIAEFNQRIAAGEMPNLTSCDFRHINLRGLIVKNLDLSDAYFRQSDLRGIDFSECATMEGASINGAKISGSKFPSAIRADEILLSLEHGTRLRYNAS